MASEGNTSAGASSGTSLKKDPGWQYNHLKDPRDTNSVTCNFCGKTTKGGIFRAKQHQIGVGRNALSCKKYPIEVKLELEKYVKEKKAQKDGMSGKLFDFEDVEELGDDDEDVVEKDRIVGQKSGRGANLEPLSGKSASSTNKKGPMDLFMIPKKGKGPQLRQTNINDACDKEARARTIQYIARFFYQAGIPFNVARLDTFKGMIEAIGRYGPNLQPPSYHELRVPLLIEHIHTKKRNRLEHQRLHDLVYIKYNQALKARHDMWNVIDPISLNDIDDCNEWLIGEMEALDAEDELVFPNDDLRWGHVARASGVEEAPINTRRATRMQMASSTSAGTSTNRVEVEEEEEDYLGHDDMENYEEGGEEWNEDYLDDL